MQADPKMQGLGTEALATAEQLVRCMDYISCVDPSEGGNRSASDLRLLLGPEERAFNSAFQGGAGGTNHAGMRFSLWCFNSAFVFKPVADEVLYPKTLTP